MATQTAQLQLTPDTSSSARGITLTLQALISDPVTLTSIIVLIVVVIMATSANLLAPHDPALQNLRLRNQPPMTASVSDVAFPHVMGTDQLGRDIFSRIIFGARTSVVIGLTTTIISGAFGTTLGIIAGYYGGWIDDIIMRMVDVVMSIPSLLFALLLLFIVGPGFWNLIIALAAFRWMLYARIGRGQALFFRKTPFIDAAVAMGASDAGIIWRHILPNVASPLIILATTEVAILILAEAGLSFLGFGLQTPSVSWGGMI
ncbi:MAG: ABC transporter permease, partial [Chloroflexota bacterium]